MEHIETIKKNLIIKGYILDTSILNSINDIALQIVSKPKINKRNITNINEKFEITTSPNNKKTFKSYEPFLAYLNKENVSFKSVSLEYSNSEGGGVIISFEKDGRVNVSSFGSNPDFQFNTERLIREIEKCEQEYNWIVKSVFFSNNFRYLKMLFSYIFIISSLLLVSFTFIYFSAYTTAIDIDSNLIPQGNEYFNAVEEAIKSNDITKKIDILLVSELRYFNNRSDLLTRYSSYIRYVLIFIVILTIAIFMYRKLRSLYPEAFFLFEGNQKLYGKLEKKRDYWGIVIIIGFILEIVGGLTLALFI